MVRGASAFELFKPRVANALVPRALPKVRLGIVTPVHHGRRIVAGAALLVQLRAVGTKVGPTGIGDLFAHTRRAIVNVLVGAHQKIIWQAWLSRRVNGAQRIVVAGKLDVALQLAAAAGVKSVSVHSAATTSRNPFLSAATYYETAAMQELKRRDEELQDRFEPAQVNLAGAAGALPNRMVNVAPRSANTMDEQFPTADLKADDERDKVMAAKLALQDPARPGYTQFGKLEATDADFKWLQKKQAAVEEANFQLWFAKEYDRMSPAEKKRAKELYPEFYAQRKKLLKKQAKNLVRLASIKLEGVESFDDLRLQYEAETGRLDVGPLTHLLHPEQNNNHADYEQRKFQRGLLSPFRVFGDEAVARDKADTLKQTRDYQAQAFNAYKSPEDGLGLTQGFPPLPSGGATTFAQTGDKDWFATMRSLLQ